MAGWPQHSSPTLCPGPRKDGEAPESDIVQAHACQHEQEAVPQYPLVVLLLLPPCLRPLWPHVVKLGPVLCVGGFPGAAEEQEGRGKMKFSGRLRGGDTPSQDYDTCVSLGYT